MSYIVRRSQNLKQSIQVLTSNKWKWKIVSNFVDFSKYLTFVQDYLAGNKLHWTTFYLK